MTPEQRLFWDRLKFDAQYFAHICGKEMLGKSEDTVNNLAKDYLDTAMDHLSMEDLASVMKTWLSFYHLPLDPCKLGEAFDRFHYHLGEWIKENHNKVKMIGCY